MAIEWNKLNTISNVYRYTGGSYSYEYGQNTADIDLFVDNFAVDDAIYFIANGGLNFGRPKNPYKFSGLRISISVPISADVYEYVWEYYASDGSWKQLPNINDPSNGLSISGIHDITWTVPTDWKEYSKLNDDYHNGSGYIVRLRVTNVNNPAEGGHIGSDTVKIYTYAFWIDDGNEYTPYDLWNFDNQNSIGLIEKICETDTNVGWHTYIVKANIVVNHGMLKIPYRNVLIVGESPGNTNNSFEITLNGNEDAMIYINGGILKWNNGYYTGSYHYWGKDGFGKLKIDNGGKLWKYGYSFQGFTFEGDCEIEDASLESGDSYDTWYFTTRAKGYVHRSNLQTYNLYIYTGGIDWNDLQLRTSDIITTSKRLLAGVSVFHPTVINFDFRNSIEWISVHGCYFVVINPKNIPDGYPKLGNTYNKYSGYAIRAHQIHVKVVDVNGNPIEGAKVQILDKNGHTALIKDCFRTDGWTVRNLYAYDVTSGAFAKYAKDSFASYSYQKPDFLNEGDTIRLRWEYITLESLQDNGNFTCLRNQSYNGYDSLAIGGYSIEPVMIEVDYLMTDSNGEIRFSGEYCSYEPFIITDVWAEDYDYNNSWLFVDPQYEVHLNPFTIIVKKYGYRDFVMTMNIVDETIITVVMQPDPFQTKDEAEAGNINAICN